MGSSPTSSISHTHYPQDKMPALFLPSFAWTLKASARAVCYILDARGPARSLCDQKPAKSRTVSDRARAYLSFCGASDTADIDIVLAVPAKPCRIRA